MDVPILMSFGSLIHLMRFFAGVFFDTGAEEVALTVICHVGCGDDARVLDVVEPRGPSGVLLLDFKRVSVLSPRVVAVASLAVGCEEGLTLLFGATRFECCWRCTHSGDPVLEVFFGMGDHAETHVGVCDAANSAHWPS